MAIFFYFCNNCVVRILFYLNDSRPFKKKKERNIIINNNLSSDSYSWGFLKTNWLDFINNKTSNIQCSQILESAKRMTILRCTYPTATIYNSGQVPNPPESLKYNFYLNLNIVQLQYSCEISYFWSNFSWFHSYTFTGTLHFYSSV